ERLSLSCFVSGRRRHTRFSRDWSSDVCSSDLPVGFGGAEVDPDGLGVTDVQVAVGLGREAGVHPPAVPPRRPVGVDDLLDEMGWLLPWFCHRDRSLQASFSGRDWHHYTTSVPFGARRPAAQPRL